MAEEVGGFFASLRLMTDDSSFQRGQAAVKGVGDSLAGMLKAGLAIAGITLGFKEFLHAADQAGKTLLMGDYLDMTAKSVIEWRGAVDEAGGSAEGFIGSIKTLHQNLIRLKEEGMDPGSKFFQNIAQLNVPGGPEALIKMSQGDQVKALMNAAMNSKDKDLGNDLILQLMGQDALQTVLYSRRTGKSINSLLTSAGKRNYMNDKDMAGALAGSGEFRKLGDTGAGMFSALSAKTMAALAPQLELLNTWLEAHRDDIANMTTALGNLAGVLLGKAAGMIPSGVRILEGKATTEDWFPGGLPWQGRFWTGMADDFRRDFLGGGKNPIGAPEPWELMSGQNPPRGSVVHIEIRDRTSGGVQVSHDALGIAGQSR